MRTHQVSPALAESHPVHSTTLLHGRWPLLARGGWISLAVLSLAIFFGSLPVYLRQLRTPCAGTACSY
jgi:hypothetical protein